MPDVISFDHDLGFEHYCFGDENPTAEIPYNSFTEKTGYDCAKWLVENNKLPKEYRVHSMNPVGAKNIQFIMESGQRRLTNER